MSAHKTLGGATAFAPTGAGRIPFANGAGNALIDSDDYKWDDSLKTLTLKGTSPIIDMIGSIWRLTISQSGGIINIRSPTNDRWINIETSGSGVVNISPGGVQRLRIDTADLATWKDGINHVLGSTNGSKIGTAITQKLALWNATPIVQPSSTGQTAGHTGGSGGAVTDDSTFTGGSGTKAYTFGDVVKHLKAIGALAAS